jgi:HipA-like kinase
VRALRTVRVTRYVTPLREGGSLPAIVDADDDGLYVLKFRGAGQGARALIAELVSGEIARTLGLPVPEIVFAELDRDLARTEPDREIHQLIFDSGGLNLAIDYLPGSVSYDPAIHRIGDDLASRIVWLDALVSNVDRTARNTNMLMWHREPWLIDHGATLYFHHTPGWDSDVTRARAQFPLIKDHVLLRSANRLEAEDETLARVLTADAIDEILGLVPDEWLADPAGATGASALGKAEASATAGQLRSAYGQYLRARLKAPRAFVSEAVDAR